MEPKYPVFKPTAEDGYPAKNDTLHLVTLQDNIFNGYTLPFPAGTEYPAYMVVNQDNKIMRIPRDDGSKAADMTLFWGYRQAGHLQGAISDLKRLRTWQRYHYGKGVKQAEPVEVIRLPARGNWQQGFEVSVKSLLGLIRDLPSKAYLAMDGYLFPAQTLAEICRVASADTMRIGIEKEREFTGLKEELREKYTKTTPAMVIRHGSAKTCLMGQKLDEYTAHLQIVTCVI